MVMGDGSWHLVAAKEVVRSGGFWMCFEVRAGRSCRWTERMWEMRNQATGRGSKNGGALGTEVPHLL